MIPHLDLPSVFPDADDDAFSDDLDLASPHDAWFAAGTNEKLAEADAFYPRDAFRNPDRYTLLDGFAVGGDARLGGADTFADLLGDGVDVGHLDGANGQSVAYNFSSGPDDFDYGIVAPPPRVARELGAAGAALEAYFGPDAIETSLEDATVFAGGPEGSRLEALGILGVYYPPEDYPAVRNRLVIPLTERARDPDSIRDPAVRARALNEIGAVALHEGIHKQVVESGLYAALSDNLPPAANHAVQEGLAQYAIRFVDPDRRIDDPPYEAEVRMVDSEMMPNIGNADQSSEEVFRSALRGDPEAQLTIVNVSRALQGLGPVERLETPAGGLAGGTDRVRP